MLERNGFSGAGRADDAEYLALPDLERKIVEDGFAAEAFRHVLEFHKAHLYAILVTM